MSKLLISNPEKLNHYKFAVDNQPFFCKYLGNNSELSNPSISWSIHKSGNLGQDYRVSLVLNSEIEPGDFVGKFRIIIHNLQTATSRVKFMNKEEIEDLETFGKIIVLEISNIEYRTTNFLPF
jgi:hypothetical protein